MGPYDVYATIETCISLCQAVLHTQKSQALGAQFQDTNHTKNETQA